MQENENIPYPVLCVSSKFSRQFCNVQFVSDGLNRFTLEPQIFFDNFAFILLLLLPLTIVFIGEKLIILSSLKALAVCKQLQQLMVNIFDVKSRKCQPPLDLYERCLNWQYIKHQLQFYGLNPFQALVTFLIKSSGIKMRFKKIYQYYITSRGVGLLVLN